MGRSRGILALGAMIVFIPQTAAAGMERGQSQGHVFVGGLVGDDLTDTRISGDQPELDDDVVFGLRYDYFFTKHWGLDVSLGFTPNKATDVPGGDVDLDILMLDVSAIWNFTPDARAVGYLVFGGGFAAADLDSEIRGFKGSRSVSIDDDSSFTLNGGVGVNIYATDRFLVRGEARYRYFDQLVDDFEDSLGAVEVTGGVGWVF